MMGGILLFIYSNSYSSVESEYHYASHRVGGIVTMVFKGNGSILTCAVENVIYKYLKLRCICMNNTW